MSHGGAQAKGPSATSSSNGRPGPQRRTTHTGQHQGLQSKSAKRALAPTEVYLGLSFRMLEPGEPFPAASEEFAHRDFKEDRASDEDVSLEGEQRIVMWSAVVSDGVGTIDTGRDSVVVNTSRWRGEEDWDEVKKVVTKVVHGTLEASRAQSLVVQIVAVSEPLPQLLAACPGFLPSMWTHLNAIPFIIRPPTLLFDDLPDPSPEYYAQTAVTAAIKHLHPAIHSALAVGTDSRTHEVLVDAGGQVKIASLKGYEQSTTPELWRRFMALVRHVKARKISAIFASATPSGGGVALMRHALVRLMRLVDIDVRWVVPEGHPAVFSLTKQHMHNVLQGVSKHDETMGPKDQQYFEAWTRGNWEAFWKDSGLFDDGRLVVIDDPQLTPLIPLVKAKNPSAKILFRSHIQIQSDLTDDPKTRQAEVFNYLWKFIKQTDVFLAHPVEFFVPKIVKESKMPVMYMPPSTDPIDGLNKPLGNESVVALRDAYNNLSRAQCGVEMDWDRGYVLQVARFDPSKGLPVLLEAYLKFRQAIKEDNADGALDQTESPAGSPKVSIGRRRGSSSASRRDGVAPMSPATPTSPRSHKRRNSSYDFGQAVGGPLTAMTAMEGEKKQPPMLVIVGHGSVDDPDGSALYEQCHQIVQSEGYELIRDDVSIVRAPPSDTLLGMLMQGAWVTCQLSTREGFEVKVSEAVLKRVPVIVSKAGGLSLQVKEGVNGWLVESGESEPVATILTELWEGKRSLKRGKGRPEIREAKAAGDLQHKQDGDKGESVLPGSESRSVVDQSGSGEGGNTHKGVYPPLQERRGSRSAGNQLGLQTNLSDVQEGKMSKPSTQVDESLDLDPNTVADIFCEDVGRPFPAIYTDSSSPPEDFFTIGNAARWLLLWSLLDGRGVQGSQGLADGDQELLQSMGLPLEDVHSQGQQANGQDIMRKYDGKNVWRMTMASDMKEGEGVVL